MSTVTKGELVQNLQKYLRQVEETGEEVIVTSNNTPILKIVSLKNTDDFFADDGKAKHHGSIMEQKRDDWEEF